MTLPVLGALVFGALLASLAVSRAEEKAEPIVLVIDGKTGSGRPIAFTLSQIEAIPHVTMSTRTPWHDGVATFTGVPMDALMTQIGAKGDTLNVAALDRYCVELSLADLKKYHALMAYRLNGALMSVADKGPLFVVYPYDSEFDLVTRRFYARSPWQIARLTIE